MKPKRKQIPVDLHVHTVASACAEPEMVPPLIARRARDLGLGMFAVTDHHSVENVHSVSLAAAPYGIRVLPGMEVQSREEVHVLCLFESIENALEFQSMVWRQLPRVPNREEFFGIQRLVDARGKTTGTNPRLLQTSVTWTFEQVLAAVESHGGLALPAHVDRPKFSLFANLGMIPEGVVLAGAEISGGISAQDALGRFPQLKGIPLIQSGDAHRLEEMTNTTRLTIEDVSLREFRLALQGLEGREIAFSACGGEDSRP